MKNSLEEVVVSLKYDHKPTEQDILNEIKKGGKIFEALFSKGYISEEGYILHNFIGKTVLESDGSEYNYHYIVKPKTMNLIKIYNELQSKIKYQIPKSSLN